MIRIMRAVFIFTLSCIVGCAPQLSNLCTERGCITFEKGKFKDVTMVPEEKLEDAKTVLQGRAFVHTDTGIDIPGGGRTKASTVIDEELRGSQSLVVNNGGTGEGALQSGTDKVIEAGLGVLAPAAVIGDAMRDVADKTGMWNAQAARNLRPAQFHLNNANQQDQGQFQDQYQAAKGGSGFGGAGGTGYGGSGFGGISNSSAGASANVRVTNTPPYRIPPMRGDGRCHTCRH